MMTKTDIETLWAQYYSKVYGYFFRRVNNCSDIEDLTSITLTIFLKDVANEEKEIQNQPAYLWKIAHNQLLVFIRNKTKHPISISIEDGNFSDYNESLEEPEYENYRSEGLKLRIEKLMHCVRKNLGQAEIYIIEKIIMEDKKAVEIAVDLNLKPDNVRQKLSRSLKKLRQECKLIWEN